MENKSLNLSLLLMGVALVFVTLVNVRLVGDRKGQLASSKSGFELVPNISGRDLDPAPPHFPRYEIIDLGVLPGLPFNTVIAPVEVSDAGDVTGVMVAVQEDIWKSFFWSNGVLSELPDPDDPHPPLAVDVKDMNNNGTIAGYSTFPNHALLWLSAEDAPTSLLSGGGSPHVADGVNNFNQVVGRSNFGNGYRGFSWTEAGGITQMGTLGGDYSEAVAINNNGQIACNAEIVDGTTRHACLWQGKNLVDLGTLGGSKSEAVEINDLGHVVGMSLNSVTNTDQAFIWRDGVMESLGSIHNNNTSRANDINNRDEVVGSAGNFGFNPIAFLWRDGQTINLNNVLPVNSGWLSLVRATAINDRGFIAGMGVKNDGQVQVHGFLLRPINP